jgi:hypothetical protein
VRFAPAQDKEVADGIGMWLASRAIRAHTRHVATVAIASPIEELLLLARASRQTYIGVFAPEGGAGSVAASIWTKRGL